MHQSTRQTSDDFDSFTTNLEKLVVNISVSKSAFILMIGNFNAKSHNRSSNDATTAKVTVYCYHVKYAFQSQCILYSCLNVKEFLARDRRKI